MPDDYIFERSNRTRKPEAGTISNTVRNGRRGGVAAE